MTNSPIVSLLLSSENIARFLLTWSWQALLLIGFVWLLCRRDRSRRASVRHQIWLCGLAAVALIPLLSFTEGWLSANTPQSELVARVVALPDKIAPATTVAGRETVANFSASVPNELGAQADLSLYAYAAVCVVWFGGMFVSLLKIISRRSVLEKICFRARPVTYSDIGLDELDVTHLSNVSLRLSTEVSSPMLVGLRHKIVLLPARITEWTSVAECQAIIRHELAHLRRRDSYVLVFQSLLGTIFFFHPAVRYAFRQLSVEREMACDEAVVGSGVNATVYADTLLKVAEWTLSPQYKMEAMRFVSSKKTLERRVDGIMNNRFLDSRRRWVFMVLPLLLLLTAVWFIGSARAVQMSREEAEIREFLRQVSENEMRRDPETFNRLAAPEFIRFGANGEVWNKEQTLAFGRAPRSSTLLSVERQDEKIRIYGDTAIITGLGIARMRNAAGREYEVHNLCTFVLVKRDGRWLCVSVQQTRQP